MVFAVVTGGGTSGHVIPAQAILGALSEAGFGPSELKYVGSRRGIETSLMKDSVYESVFLPISGLQRSLTLGSLGRNVALVWRLVYSRFLARRLLSRWQPRVIVSVGGYASQPMASAARSRDVPLVCVSYDRIAGLATRRQARYASVCAVAFADTDLPHAVHTGAPVRAELRHLDVAASRRSARQELGIDADAVCLVVVGGSLGSAVLNNAVPDLAEQSAHLDNVVIYHVCGARNESDPLPKIPPSIRYIRRGYESRMAQLYAASDLLVARAGASTVAEIATVGVASVLVPWSAATENHQQLNASWLGDHGAAVVLSEEVLATNDGIQAVVQLLESSERRRHLATAAYEMGGIHRGKSLVETIQNVAR